MRDGIINVYKEQNMTSHDVVSRIRRLMGIRRVGHTGTLDPMAEGVLPVCIGRATRIMEYLDLDWKRYRCRMVLGRRMDTQDIWGEEVERVPEEQVNAVTEEQVRKVFESFDGVIWQTPPMYSALKVNGRKLYEYARAGETVEVKRRQICIRNMTLEELDLHQGYDSSITFSCECTKGTYIRSICEEAGEQLGVLGAMAALTRTATGVFSIEQSLKLHELEELGENLPQVLTDIPEPLVSFGEIELSGRDVWRFTNGLTVWKKNCRIRRQPLYEQEEFPLPMREEFRRAYCVYGDDGTFLGVGFLDGERNELKADKVFCPGN